MNSIDNFVNTNSRNLQSHCAMQQNICIHTKVDKGQFRLTLNRFHLSARETSPKGFSASTCDVGIWILGILWKFFGKEDIFVILIIASGKPIALKNCEQFRKQNTFFVFASGEEVTYKQYFRRTYRWKLRWQPNQVTAEFLLANADSFSFIIMDCRVQFWLFCTRYWFCCC